MFVFYLFLLFIRNRSVGIKTQGGRKHIRRTERDKRLQKTYRTFERPRPHDNIRRGLLRQCQPVAA